MCGVCANAAAVMPVLRCSGGVAYVRASARTAVLRGIFVEYAGAGW